MNEKVFISGSISLKDIPEKAKKSLQNIIQANLDVLVGDADGIDSLIQQFYDSNNYHNVTIYSISDFPRNRYSSKFAFEKVIVSDEIKKERERQTFKDVVMTKDCDYGFVIWDGKSKGSYNNILRFIEQNKPVKVFLNTTDDFLPKSDININNINYIFSESNGYTASEIVEYLKEDGITNFKNTRELNKYLLENKIIIKNDDIYEPLCLNELFIIETYRGKNTGIKFRNSFIDWIKESIPAHYKSQPLF